MFQYSLKPLYQCISSYWFFIYDHLDLTAFMTSKLSKDFFVKWIVVAAFPENPSHLPAWSSIFHNPFGPKVNLTRIVVVVVYRSSRFPCGPRLSSCYLHVLPGKRVDAFFLQIIMWISVVVSAESHSSRAVYTRYCDVKTHSPVCTVSFDHSSWLHHDLGNDIKRPVTFNLLTCCFQRNK